MIKLEKKDFKGMIRFDKLDTWANYTIMISVLLLSFGYLSAGFSLSIIANVLFMYLGLKTKMKSFIPCNLILILLNTWGLINFGFGLFIN